MFRVIQGIRERAVAARLDDDEKADLHNAEVSSNGAAMPGSTGRPD